MTEEKNARALIAPQLFQHNAIYRQLRPSSRENLDQGLEKRLWEIEHDEFLTAAEKERERKYFLEVEALEILNHSWKLQQSMEGRSGASYSGRRTRNNNGELER
jgi:hypothetical protein